MALVLNDRVKETTTTTGTGTINLAGAATNFETFVAGIGDGNTVYYAIVHQDQAEFEVGLGTVTDATPDTLSRTTILSSSNSDGLVSFSAGTKDVFCTLPASKTVFEDASSNVTLPGTVTAVGTSVFTNLDISGDVDVDGTLEADAMTLDGTAITTTATLSTGISNNNVPKFTSGVVDDDFLRVNGTAIEGRSASEVLSDIGASAAAGSSSIVTTGALDSGSITSGFGTINNGSSTITTTGAITGGSLVADNITIDGTEIDLSSGDLTIDSAGRIDLSADDNGEVRLFDGSSMYAQFKDDSDRLSIQTLISDADMLFVGNDGGSEVTALTLDMSDAGSAIFNHDVRVGDNNFLICGAGDDLAISSDGTNGSIATGNGNFSVDCANTIKLDADNAEIQFLDGGTEIGIILMTNQDFKFESKVQDKDIIFRGNDGGSEINALALDMSEAGAATFNNNVTAFSDERLKDNIQTLEDGLAKVEKLRGVTYTRDNRENIGVIAQEVEKILPEIVLTADDEMGTKSVDYSRITAVLIEAVKDLSERVKELENK
tara:strand:+ start:3197 stop:4837 length:1641 start_codon:yes stop_codon:yes gene_type:complete